MRTLLTTQCRGCGWPATNGRNSCEGCARPAWAPRNTIENIQRTGSY